jgi:predicted Ser/Thr protein kinase
VTSPRGPGKEVLQSALALFDALRDLPTPEREPHLARTAAEVRALVERMLDVTDGSALPIELGAVAARAFGVPEVPEEVGGYRIVRPIGAGGNGVVWEALQREPRRSVALKTLPGRRWSERTLARFRREAQALADLRHPGVPQVYEAGVEGDTPFLAMELVDGVPLNEWAARAGEAARVRVLAQVCRAVAHAHGVGVIHRDLKPGNILVTAEGAPRVVDFGVAVLGDADPSEVVGTPAFAAPEQLRGEVVDARADVYALGVTAREVLAGRRDGQPADADLRAVLDVATAAEPAARYASAAELGDDLERWLAHRPVAARVTPVGHRVALFARRHRAAVQRAGLVALVAAAAALGAAGWQAREVQVSRQAAFDSLAALDRRADDAGSAGDPAEARRLLVGWLDDPAHDPAASAAWLHHAARSAGDDAFDAATRAWATAATTDDERAALLSVAEQLHACDRDLELDVVLPFLAATGPVPAELELRAALARRDLLAAADLDPVGLGPVWRALARGRPTDVVHGGLGATPGGGRAVRQSAEGGFSYLRAADLGDDGPIRVAGVSPREVVAASADSGVARLSATEVGWFDDGGATLVARLPESGARMVAAEVDVDGDGVRERWFGTSAYTRHLLRIHDDGTWTSPCPACDGSDVRALTGVDLTGDGVDELIVGLGPWRHREVRVLTGGDLRTLAQLRVGDVGSVVPWRVGDEVWLAVGVREGVDPAGASGVALFAWETDRLAPRGFLRGPDGWTPGPPQVGDLDGDGLDELVITEPGGTRVVRQLPGGRLATGFVGGLQAGWMLGADGPGPEALVGVLAEDPSRRRWLLGAGDVLLPPIPRPEPPRDRVLALAKVGSWAAAVELGLSRAVTAGDEDAAAAAVALAAGADPEQALAVLWPWVERSPAARAAAARAAAAAHSFADAAHLAATAEDRRRWGALAAPLPSAEVPLEGALGARWIPGRRVTALALTGDREVFSAPLATSGPRFGVELSFALEAAEIGAGFTLAAGGAAVTLASTGGDQRGRVTLACGDVVVWAGEVGADARSGRGLRVTLDVAPGEGTARCEVWDDGARAGAATLPLPGGAPAALTWSTRSLGPWLATARVAVSSLVVRGAVARADAGDDPLRASVRAVDAGVPWAPGLPAALAPELLRLRPEAARGAAPSQVVAAFGASFGHHPAFDDSCAAAGATPLPSPLVDLDAARVADAAARCAWWRGDLAGARAAWEVLAGTTAPELAELRATASAELSPRRGAAR